MRTLLKLPIIKRQIFISDQDGEKIKERLKKKVEGNQKSGEYWRWYFSQMSALYFRRS